MSNERPGEKMTEKRILHALFAAVVTFTVCSFSFAWSDAATSATQDGEIETVMPVTPTTCPAIPTACPAVETQCPASTSGSCGDPRIEVQGMTKKSGGNTVCPRVSTQCPSINTKCPQQDTHCPTQQTQCPRTSSQCPVQDTQCPTVNTKCPATNTKCPTADTKCPPQKTQCPATETKCPTADTNCPAVDTKCPATETKCPASQTKCPATETKCPADETKCPVEAGKCGPGMSVTYRVKDTEGKPAAGAWLAAWQPCMRSGKAVTDEAGSAKVPGLVGGTTLRTYVIAADGKLAAEVVTAPLSPATTMPIAVVLRPARAGKVYLEDADGKRLPGMVLVFMMQPRAGMSTMTYEEEKDCHFILKADTAGDDKAATIDGLLSGTKVLVKATLDGYVSARIDPWTEWTIAPGDANPTLTLKFVQKN
jgi:hypothetical protein